MKIHELKYSNTNTYLIVGDRGSILFDTGWAGTFAAFCRCMGEIGIPVQDIGCILISHFHPDHMGIAQEIADIGPVIVVTDVQEAYIHSSDGVFEKEGSGTFKPIDDAGIRHLRISDSRDFLREFGIDGEIIHTPGHSDDSISLWTDDGALFVGDLNPLYELDLHRGTRIGESWERLLTLKPKTVYYGHALRADLTAARSDDRIQDGPSDRDVAVTRGDLYTLVSRIMRLTDKGVSLDRIRKKTGADMSFIEDVSRMYLTHRDVGVRGILDRIEIKGR